MNLNRIYSISAKETKHILRDPFTLAVSLLLPLVFVCMFGFVIDLDYKNMPVMVRDNDQTPESRQFLQNLSSSGYFTLKPLHNQKQAEETIEDNSQAAVLIIKRDFGKNLQKQDLSNLAQAQLLVDGSDNARGSLILNYVNAIAQKTSLDFLDKSNDKTSNISNLIRTRFLFNPELKSRWFIVPALNTIIIGFLAIILTALTIAKEWENGSMELLLSTPVSPLEIVFGKLVPYFVLTFFDTLLVFVLALTTFRLPFAGSFPLYLLSCIVYINGALALGLVISVATRKQQAAIQFAFAVGLLPSFIFSGFIFPIENMPAFFRYFTMLFPQRWFLNISRNLFLSDSNITTLILPFTAITIFTIVMIFIAVKNFKKDVEP